MKRKSLLHIKKIVLIGLLSATITGGKLALSTVPNVEIVTLLIILYTSVFGIGISLPSTIIFVSAEMLIYGVNTWVISYYIHWCGLALMSALIKKFGKDRYYLYVIITILATASFGVLSSAIDAVLMVNTTKEGFFKCFGIIYLRGIVFYAIHIVSNAIIVSVAFIPLKKALIKLKDRYFDLNALAKIQNIDKQYDK